MINSMILGNDEIKRTYLIHLIDQYSDLAKGSFSLEKLTEDLSVKAFEIMKNFETSEKLFNFIQNNKETVSG